MFGGIHQIATISSTLTQNCKRTVKLGCNVAIICRNKTTVIDNSSSNYQSVADFYAGKSVFITGGTGFLGKFFIEKLLYSCHDIDKVFILIRDKKGQSTQERLRELLNNSIFDRVKKFRPNSLSKVVPIIGDISIPNLGISPEDEQTLQDEVSVVFHSAATIRFFEPMKLAMNLNYEATRQVMNLSRRMKNLQNFVYISTTMTQTIYPVLEEKVYPAPAELKDVQNFIEKYNHDEKKTNEFISKRPSTYTFTKAMAENYAGTCSDLPVTIVRPAMVGAALNEPSPGWIDNWFAITGSVVDVSRGLNHYCLGSSNLSCDLVPVDYVSNLALVAGAKYKSGDKVPVYNCASSGTNPVTWSYIMEIFIEESLKSKIYVEKPSVKFFKSRLMYNLATLLFQKTPAYLSDALLRLKGEEPRHMAQLRRVLTTRHSIEYYLTREFTFRADAARALYASLSKADQAEFPFDVADINWDKYLRDYYNGVKIHLLPKQLAKEKASRTSKS